MRSRDLSPPLAGRIVGGGDDPRFRERLQSELEASGLVAADASPPVFVLDLGGEVEANRADGPPLGVWRFEVAGGSPGSLREPCRAALARGQASLAVRLVARRGDAPGERTVLREGRLPLVPYSLRETIRGTGRQLARWPVYACRGLLATGELEGPRTLGDGSGGQPAGRGADGESPPTDGAPDPGERTSEPVFRVRLAAAWVRRLWRTLFRHDHWNVGVVDLPIEDLLDRGGTPETAWADTPPRHTFRADPFGLAVDGRTWILYEEVDYRDGRGRIVAEEWADSGEVRRRDVVLEGDTHVSYPYLLREDGEIYCVPETSASGRVHLLRAVDFPWRWERAAVLLEEVTALDSTLFRHGGRWWLFATDARSGPRHLLNAWHAERLRGEWTEHARNPIKVDVRSARPAGTPFRHEDRLYRPAQSGARRYGEALVLNRVETLTPARFEETEVRRIDPDPSGPCPDGVHTLSRLGPNRCLVDGNRARFSPHEFVRRLRESLGI